MPAHTLRVTLTKAFFKIKCFLFNISCLITEGLGQRGGIDSEQYCFRAEEVFQNLNQFITVKIIKLRETVPLSLL